MSADKYQNIFLRQMEVHLFIHGHSRTMGVSAREDEASLGVSFRISVPLQCKKRLYIRDTHIRVASLFNLLTPVYVVRSDHVKWLLAER